MIASRKSALFAVVLVTLTILVTARTSSAASLLDKDDREKVDVSNNIVPEGKQKTAKPSKVIRVPLYSIRKPRSIDTGDETINENESNVGIKSRRNSTTSEQKSSRANDISVNVLRDAKKNYKKLKMAQIQSKSLKNKEHPSDQDLGGYMDKQLTKKKIVRRHVEHNEAGSRIGNMNQINADRSNKYKDAEYYAQRQAVMDRFYARQREIQKKYGNRVSVSETNNDRYDLGLVGKDDNALSPVEVGTESIYKQTDAPKNIHSLNTLNYIPSITQAEHSLRKPRTTPYTEHNGDGQEDYEYDDEYEEETENPVHTSTTESSRLQSDSNVEDLSNDTAIDSGDGYTWGNCKLSTPTYQHNLNLRVHKGSMSEVNVVTTIDGPFCVACVEVKSLFRTKAKVTIINPSKDIVKLRVRSFQDEQLSLIVKVFVGRKIDDRCEAA